METIRKAMSMVALAALMETGFGSGGRMDISMRKRDTNKPRPDAKKLRKRKLQKEARKINRK